MPFTTPDLADENQDLRALAPILKNLGGRKTFWGQIVAEALATFDIADNELDNFTGDGSETDFALNCSYIPP